MDLFALRREPPRSRLQFIRGDVVRTEDLDLSFCYGPAGYFLYNFVTRKADTRIFDLYQEMFSASIREPFLSLKEGTPVLDAVCVCGGTSEVVAMRTAPPANARWLSRACFRCRAIIGPRSPKLWPLEGRK